MFHGEELVSNILTMRYELYIFPMICTEMKSNKIVSQITMKVCKSSINGCQVSLAAFLVLDYSVVCMYGYLLCSAFRIQVVNSGISQKSLVLSH